MYYVDVDFWVDHCICIGGNVPWSYFIRGGDYVKIGSAKNPVSRIGELQTGNPFTLELVAVSDEDESHLHAKFSKSKKRGEWFFFTAEIVEFLLSSFSLAYDFRSVVQLRALSVEMQMPEHRIMELTRPYRESDSVLMKGEWQMFIEDRSTRPTGMRLFSELSWNGCDQ